MYIDKSFSKNFLNNIKKVIKGSFTFAYENDFINDIDFRNKTISVNKNILKKNQVGGTKKRHISGNSTTVWYFGTCKTQTSYRTIPIGETLLNALKEYKKEQEENKKNYGDTYMKHYKKKVQYFVSYLLKIKNIVFALTKFQKKY